MPPAIGSFFGLAPSEKSRSEKSTQKVFGVVGATSSVAIVFVMPSAFYLKLMGPLRGGGPDAALVAGRMRAASWAMIVLGGVVCPACVTGVVMSLIKQAKQHS